MAGKPYIKMCARSECPNSFYNSRGGHLKAGATGWFHQKNGDSWCPACLPDWVAEWRKQKAQRKESRG